MKSNMNMRIIKLAMAEIVMQCGFERVSEQALNIMSDVFRHYLEQILQRMHKMEETHISFECTAKAIINDFIVEDSYQERELSNFLHTQIQQKKYLGEKVDDDSLLHTLKVIPKSVDLTNVCRTTNSFSLMPNIKNGSSNVSLEVDPDMDDFINGCLSETSRRGVVGEYKYSLLEILNKDTDNYKREREDLKREDVNKGEVPSSFFSGQTFSILNDFNYKEIRKVFKNLK